MMIVLALVYAVLFSVFWTVAVTVWVLFYLLRTAAHAIDAVIRSFAGEAVPTPEPPRKRSEPRRRESGSRGRIVRFPQGETKTKVAGNGGCDAA